MAYPGPKVHRANRRKLGRGQYPAAGDVVVSVAGSASTAVLTFSAPVSFYGVLTMTVATRTFVGQVVNTPTQATLTFNGAVTGLAWSIPGNQNAVRTFTGGRLAGASGTFS